MKIKLKDGQLNIETIAYQAKNGAVYLDWGNTVIKLEKDYAENICYDIPEFDIDAFNKYYLINKY